MDGFILSGYFVTRYVFINRHSRAIFDMVLFINTSRYIFLLIIIWEVRSAFLAFIYFWWFPSFFNWSANPSSTSLVLLICSHALLKFGTTTLATKLDVDIFRSSSGYFSSNASPSSFLFILWSLVLQILLKSGTTALVMKLDLGICRSSSGYYQYV